jgi:hypothetical protein
MENMPIWFKLFLGLFGILILTATIRYCLKGKTIQAVAKLTAEKRDTIIEKHSTIIKIYQIFLWMFPLYLIVIPIVIYIYSRSDFIYFLIMMVLIFVVVLEDFIFRRSLISAYKND